MGKRPDHVKPPAYLSKSPPVPVPDESAAVLRTDENRLDPTRYGDWEKNGVAIDF
jgi:hypothetical protein